MSGNVRDFGAVGDGATDDTGAFAAALSACHEVHVPSGVYAVSSTVTVPTGKRLSGEWSSIYTSIPTVGARIRRIGPDVEPVVKLSKNAALSSLAVIGNQVGDGVKLGGRNLVRDVTIATCKTGIDCAYTGVNRIEDCQIHDNKSDGILNPVDSMITHCYLNVNGRHGVNMQSGAGDNLLTHCKLEWNVGHGVQMYQTRHNVVSTNIVDRNGCVGIKMVHTARTVVTANVLRRNGRLSELSAPNDSHLLMENCGSCQVFGNVTMCGGDDGGGNYVSPRQSLRVQDCADVNVLGNDLSGCTGASAVTTVGAGERVAYSMNT